MKFFALISPPPVSHPLLHPPKTLYRLLGHSLFLGKGVAPQVHLPAWNAVHHPWVPVWAHGFDELGVRLRPLVEVDVSCPDGDSGIIHTARYANGAHFPVSGSTDMSVMGAGYKTMNPNKAWIARKATPREREGLCCSGRFHHNIVSTEYVKWFGIINWPQLFVFLLPSIMTRLKKGSI